MFGSKRSVFLTPEEAEYLAAAYMKRYLGFRDARVTSASNDEGVDVRAKQAIAQVKHWKSQVSRPDLQRLYGSRGVEKRVSLLFFSSGGYSNPAVTYADKNGVALYGFNDASQVWPVNTAAKRFLVPAGKRRAEVLGTATSTAVKVSAKSLGTAASVVDGALRERAGHKREAVARRAASLRRADGDLRDSVAVSREALELEMASRGGTLDDDTFEQYVSKTFTPTASMPMVEAPLVRHRKLSRWRIWLALLLILFSLGPVLSWADYSLTTRIVVVGAYYLAALLLVFRHFSKRRAVE